MAGQIVMEGFLSFRMRPWLRRLITRMAAVVPAVITIYIAGNEATYQLLILSQVILSMQLPFAVIPLIHFTSDRLRMGVFANPFWVRALAWLTAAIVVSLNIHLAFDSVRRWMETAGPNRWIVTMLVAPLALLLLAMLLYITVEPFLARWLRRLARRPFPAPAPVDGELAPPAYNKILVPLDHSAVDRFAVAHAASIAKAHSAKLVLLHVEEDVTSQIYGQMAATAEVQAGMRYLEETASKLRSQGVDVETVVCFSNRPRQEIIRCARRIAPDLVVMGAHGHKGLEDLVFGSTIDGVRHELRAPIMIVREPGG